MNVHFMKSAFCFIVICFAMGCAQKASPEYIEALAQHRVEYKKGFAEGERAPIRTKEELDLMDFYPADESYSCTCKFEVDSDAPIIEMATYAGKKKNFMRYGSAHCEAKGQKISLGLYKNAQHANHPIYGKKMFLPFKDYTNGESTYGGGRYMDVPTSNIKGDEIVLDFNHCYNPWCAYSDGYNCPIPPIENHLKIEMLVGEKSWKGQHKKK